MRLYFEDEDFDGQLQRSIGKADSGMANVGECLTIASRVTPGDRQSWSPGVGSVRLGPQGAG
jgi:hypothetical protein